MEALTTWVALMGALWALFAAAERLIPLATQRSISAWLCGESPASHWATTFVAMCDGLFGTPGVSEQGFWRVSLAVCVLAMLLMCVVGVLYPGASAVLLLFVFLSAPLLIGTLALVNLVPGYLGLLLTRALTAWLSRQPRPGRVSVWLLAHVLSTSLVAVLGCTLSIAVMAGWSRAHLLRGAAIWLNGYVDYVLASDSAKGAILLDLLRLQPVVVPRAMLPSLGTWLYTPCFAAFYLWIYVLAGFLIRGLTAWRPAPSGQLSPLWWDILQRPLHALALVAVLLGSLVYWGALWGTHR